MKTTAHTRRFRPLPFAALLAVGGCGGPSTSSDEAIATFSLTTRAGITDYAVEPGPLKRAAAGYFRTVAAAARNTGMAQLGKRIEMALYSEKGVHGSLDREAQTKVDRRLEQLGRARRAEDRRAIAMASLAVYRLLVEDMADSGKVPTGVPLIDYAGLVSAVQLGSPATNWAEMDRAARLARARWSDFADKVGDSALKGEFAASLDAWGRAIARRDRAAAGEAIPAIQAQTARLRSYFERG